jgi:3-oxoacyl-[acyl-carrier protein] reductase
MTAERRSLADTVSVITGASAGIGQATARALVAGGGKVVLGARREDRLRELVDELGMSSVATLAMDVRSAEDNDRLIQFAYDSFGRLDSCVLNAGIGFYGSIVDGTDEEMKTMIDTNFTGTVWGIRSATRAFLNAGTAGDVVVVASVAGMRGGANEAVYAATKFAQVGLAGSVDRELREKGIRITTICPAAVKTEFAIGTGRADGDPWLDTVLQAEDVADAVRFTLEQPRRLRTTVMSMWSMAEAS